ncbi:hypothetical protein FRC00_012188 [Tulasnella sp. 408]|nr:hypothetical protein FRC00_012188 [Tulasnella sp. 408]
MASVGKDDEQRRRLSRELQQRIEMLREVKGVLARTWSEKWQYVARTDELERRFVAEMGATKEEALTEVVGRAAAGRVERLEDERLGAKDVAGVVATDWGEPSRGEAGAEKFKP